MARRIARAEDQTPRLLAAILLLGTGVVGALVRFGGFAAPWLAKYGGDAVWASAWMFGVLVLWPRMGVERAAVVAGGICATIEFFQLTPVPAALAERGFVFRLLLGSTFGWADFGAYAVGVVAAWAIVKLLSQTRRSREGQDYPAH